MHLSEHSSEQLKHRMARLRNAVAFFAMALRHGSQRNAIGLKACKRTINGILFVGRKAEIAVLPSGSAVCIAGSKDRGFTQRFG
jgi:hypothetical protein